MAELRCKGLKAIRLYDIDPITGALSNPEVLGVTFQDTCDFTREDPTEEDIFSEENEEPEESFTTRGIASLVWSIMNLTIDNMVTLMGGQSITVDLVTSYHSPRTSVDIYKGIEVETANGAIIRVNRAKVTAKENYQFRKRGVLLIDVSAKVLNPTVEALPPVEFIPAPAV